MLVEEYKAGKHTLADLTISSIPKYHTIKMSARSGAMMSNVRNPQVYEANEQRMSKDTDKNPKQKYDEGQEHAHQDLDSKYDPSPWTPLQNL